MQTTMSNWGFKWRLLTQWRSETTHCWCSKSNHSCRFTPFCLSDSVCGYSLYYSCRKWWASQNSKNFTEIWNHWIHCHASFFSAGERGSSAFLFYEWIVCVDPFDSSYFTSLRSSSCFLLGYVFQNQKFRLKYLRLNRFSQFKMKSRIILLNLKYLPMPPQNKSSKPLSEVLRVLSIRLLSERLFLKRNLFNPILSEFLRVLFWRKR